MSLPGSIAHYWHGFLAELQEAPEVEAGAPGERYEHLIQVFGFVRVEKFLRSDRVPGRPAKDRVPLARALLAKAVFDLPTTRDLREWLEVDSKLRRLGSGRATPSEATVSRAPADFAEGWLPERLLEALVRRNLGDHRVGIVSRDSTAIEARQKPDAKVPKPCRKRGRPRKGEERLEESSLPEWQQDMEPCDRLREQPLNCKTRSIDGLKMDKREAIVAFVGHLGHYKA